MHRVINPILSLVHGIKELISGFLEGYRSRG